MINFGSITLLPTLKKGVEGGRYCPLNLFGRSLFLIYNIKL